MVHYVKKLYLLYSSTNRIHCINIKRLQIIFFDKSYSERRKSMTIFNQTTVFKSAKSVHELHEKLYV